MVIAFVESPPPDGKPLPKLYASGMPVSKLPPAFLHASATTIAADLAKLALEVPDELLYFRPITAGC